MPNEYLLKEYEQCFIQLRYYDDRHSQILRYLFTLSGAVATAQFAIYRFLQGPTQGFFACQALLSIIIFIATLLLYLAMLQNRLYFVYTARQLNALRGYLMETEAGQFKDNQLYTSTEFPAFKPFSVHTFQLLGAALISSLFAGVSAYAMFPAFGQSTGFVAPILVFILAAFVEIIGGIKYLASSGIKTADHAVHGQVPGPGQP